MPYGHIIWAKNVKPSPAWGASGAQLISIHSAGEWSILCCVVFRTWPSDLLLFLPVLWCAVLCLVTRSASAIKWTLLCAVCATSTYSIVKSWPHFTYNVLWQRTESEQEKELLVDYSQSFPINCACCFLSIYYLLIGKITANVSPWCTGWGKTEFCTLDYLFLQSNDKFKDPNKPDPIWMCMKTK
jgi:hypothetical protein